MFCREGNGKVWLGGDMVSRCLLGRRMHLIKPSSSWTEVSGIEGKKGEGC